VGGGLGQHAAIARPVGYRCAATDVPDAIERMLNAFLRERASNENLRQFFARHSSDALRGLLAGTPAIPKPVERDLSPGAVPHSVEG
jgi:sulfite reductase (ferredoxin)